MSDRSIKKTEDEILEETFLGTHNISSVTECTGLIPAAPENEAEAESYAKLYRVPKPENCVSEKLKKKISVQGKKQKKGE